MNDITNGRVSTGRDAQYGFYLYVFVLWRGETHQYWNISTHPLRLDTPKKRKEKRKRNKGMTENK